MRFESVLCKLNPILKSITASAFYESNILDIQDMAPLMAKVFLPPSNKVTTLPLSIKKPYLKFWLMVWMRKDIILYAAKDYYLKNSSLNILQSCCDYEFIHSSLIIFNIMKGFNHYEKKIGGHR